MNDHQPQHDDTFADLVKATSREGLPRERHPAPRVEIVETPTRRAVAATPSTARVPHPQPWHVRYIGGNGEPLATSEQLTGHDDAHTNACAMVLLGVRAIHPVAVAKFAEMGRIVPRVELFDGDGYLLGAVPVVYVREGDAS